MDQKIGRLLPSQEVDESEAPRVPATRPGTESFAEIFQQHARFLWRALMNLGVPSHEAQDLCQEVMITAHRRLPDFDGRSLRGWLYGICVRVASDYRRSARVRREIVHEAPPEAIHDVDQAEQLDRGRALERILRVLGGLSEEKRDAFVLYEIEELTLAEVSEALGVPLQTVYSRIKAARESLRRELGSSGSNVRGGAREAG